MMEVHDCKVTNAMSLHLAALAWPLAIPIVYVKRPRALKRTTASDDNNNNNNNNPS